MIRSLCEKEFQRPRSLRMTSFATAQRQKPSVGLVSDEYTENSSRTVPTQNFGVPFISIKFALRTIFLREFWCRDFTLVD